MKGSFKKATALFLALCSITALMSGCNSSKGNSASGSSGSSYKELTVYTALPDTEYPTYINAFQKETGIKVNCVRLSAGEIVARVETEKGNPQASVIYGGSSDNMIALEKDGLLEKYKSPNLSTIPDKYQDKNDCWTPFYIGCIAIVCNTDYFAKHKLAYPTSWQDLLKPEYKGQISSAHPSTSGTAYTFLATLVQLMGEDKAFTYLKQFTANVRQYTKAGAAPDMQVGLGEAAVGISFSHDALATAKQGYKLKLCFPSEGTGYEVGALAIIKGSSSKERSNAQKFIDWSISKSGQSLFEKSGAYRLPLNKDATPPKGAVKITSVKCINYDATWAGNNRTSLINKFTQQIDNGKNLYTGS